MKRFILLFTLLTLCVDAQESIQDQYTISFPLGANRFGVIVAEDQELSKAEAQKHALIIAAALTHENGYRYFIVDAETEVVLSKKEKGPPDAYVGIKIYYERMPAGEKASSNKVPGHQIEFSCLKDKPAGKYYDSCNFGVCD